MAIDATRYRGMGREPLFPHVSLDWDTSDRQARMKLSELVGDGESDTVMADSDEAEEVWRLLDSPAEWEIIGVSRTAFERSERTLGYDIGWWGGKFYSLISDCIVAPTWHPPVIDDYAALAVQVRALNGHLLFESPESALRFRAWYTSKSWSESEDGVEFKPVRVEEA